MKSVNVIDPETDADDKVDSRPGESKAKMSEISFLSKKAVLFDLDGVLLNSRPNMERAWKDVRDRVGVTVEFEDYFKNIGRPFRDILAILGLQDQADEIEPVYSQSSKDNFNLATFYPYVVEALQKIQYQKIKLGIVTSKDRERTSIVLSRLPVKFSSVQTPNHNFRGKPAPDHLLAAMAELNVDPKDSLYIGDAEVDAMAAQRAGVDYCHANWGYGETKLEHVTFLNDINSLLVFLEIEKSKVCR
jgi:HAD superfamily hydrolase (TIGR01549 family)